MRLFAVCLCMFAFGCKSESVPVMPAEGSETLYTIPAITVEAALGAEVEVPVVIKSKPGFKINKEFPWRFEVHSEGEIESVRSEFNAEDIELSEHEARVPASIKVSQPGSHEGTIIGNFSICNDDICKFYRNEKISYRVNAQ